MRRSGVPSDPDLPPTWSSANDLEARARERLGIAVYDYVAGGAGEELTLAANRAGFERLRLRPRVLLDITSVTSETTLLGMALAAPIFVSPMGTPSHRLVHPDAVNGTAGGAADAGVAYMLSGSSALTLDIPGANRICQINILERRETADLVARAEAAGYHAICVTVDVPVAALRRRNLKHGIEPGRAAEAGSAGFANPAFSAPTTWRDIEWLRSVTTLPVLLKGIMTGEDARLAIEAGAAGVVVSNHGGRQIDHALGTIDVLPEVVDAVGKRGVVLIDGGVRTSTDVAIAIALGADAVGIGKAAMWALGAGGRVAVANFLRSIVADLVRTMALMGVTSVDALGPSHVDTRFARRP
jgi:isopentenyl diphosphate isomerase/L-lactate dehydrogenase-like FMN-dependent dehydrogenase